jgi:hypothetical protein
MKKWAFILLFGLVACNTEKKALSKTQLYLFKHPEFSAGYCAEQFPDKADSVIVKTDTVTEIQFMDSIVFDTDTLFRDSLGFKYKIKVVTKTIYKDNIIYRENRAEQERLQLALLSANKNITDLIAKNTILEQDRNDWKGKAKTRWWWIALLIGGFIGTIAIKVFSKTKFPI